MKNKTENLATLAFVAVLCLILIAGAIWYVVSANRYATYQIRTHDPVSGLIADAPVEFHGVEVGRVNSVELIDPTSVDILLDIEKTAPISAATVAVITARGLATRGFTGYVYISLEDVGTDSRAITIPPGDRYPTIPTAPSKSVSLDTTLSQVNELLQSLLDPQTIASLKQSVDSLQQITRTLAENNEKLSAIIVNTEQASNQFKPLIESSNNTVRALQTQLLPEAYRALSNLDSLSTSLAGAAEKINHDPSILIRGVAAPPPGPGESK